MNGHEDDVAFVFRDTDGAGQPNWSAPMMPLTEGQAIANLSSVGFNDNISAAWVHPRMTLTLLKDANWNGNSTVGAPFNSAQPIFDGFGAAKMKGQDQQVYDANYLGARGMNDVASSLYVQANMSQDQWRLACCRHESGPMVDQAKCGKYWSQDAASCGTMGCTGGTIMSDPVCGQWCARNPLTCNDVKKQWCQAHPGAAECGCINDTPKAQAERAKYPMITAPRQCWASSECQKTDLVQTLIPTDLAPTDCPNINAQIQEIINSTLINSTVSATMDTKNTTNGNVTVGAGDTTVAAGDGFMFYLILILIVIIVVAAAFVILDPLELWPSVQP